jgi:hypothetical protein
MSGPIRVYYAHKIEGVKIPVILLETRAMHNATAIWKAATSPPNKTPEAFLREIAAKEYMESLAKKSGIPAGSFRHYNREGWWFTQLLVIEYARWISPDFALMVNVLASKAARDLAMQADPNRKEIREKGKESYRDLSGVIDEFDPLMRKDKRDPNKLVDMKYPYAVAPIAKEVLGGTPTELREREGLGKNDNVWEKLADSVQLAIRHLVQIVAKQRLELALESTRDPNEAVKIVAKTAKDGMDANRRFLPGGDSR